MYVFLKIMVNFFNLIIVCLYFNHSINSDVNYVNDKIARGVKLLKKYSHFVPGECLRSIYFAFIYSY